MAWGHSPYCGDRKNNRSVFSKEAKKVYQKLDETTSRKTLIEAGNKGLLNALLKHFAMREKEPRKKLWLPLFRTAISEALFLARNARTFRLRQNQNNALIPLKNGGAGVAVAYVRFFFNPRRSLAPPR
jgi:hypothetical protein